MKARWLIAACGALVLLGWALWPETEPQPLAQTTQAVAAPAGTSLIGNWPAGQYLAAADDGLQRVPLPPLAAQVPAAHSLADARESGDERAPPIVRSTAAETATPAELADPQAYGRYEVRQHQRLLAAFVREAEQSLPRLQADIERGRAAGINPQQLAQAEEKARRIAAMRADLLAQHPQLAGAAAP